MEIIYQSFIISKLNYYMHQSHPNRQASMNAYTILDKPTLYPSAYLVVSNNGYTKHYYAGAERACATISIQLIQYLPFGENYVCEHTASPYTERFTFTGKERDEETGYTYHGARYYDASLMCSWFSVDPLSDKYPSMSPYNYCAWNPVKLVDPDGRELNPIYDFNGKFLGNTKEGFTGEPIIIDNQHLKNLLSKKNCKTTESLSFSDFFMGSTGAMLFDAAVADNKLPREAQVAVFADIISKIGVKNVNGNTFHPKDFVVGFYGDNPNDAHANIGVDVDKKTFYLSHQYDNYETTVENIQTTILYHEFLGHVINKWGNEKKDLTKTQGGEHYKCYKSVMDSPMYSQTTEQYKSFQERMFNHYNQ